MKHWESAKLGEIVEFINGDRGKNYPSARHRVSSGIPFINAGHLEGGRVRLGNMDYIEPARYDLLRSGKVKAGDVLLCLRGSIGRTAIVTPEIAPAAIASSLVILRPGPLVHSQFLHSYLSSPVGQHAIRASDNGAAQPNLGARDVSQFRLNLPPVAEQLSIVRILGAIDDLIENNRRRVEVLEEMARTIYHEWFVKFRYPGHEDVPLVDSARGPIPKDWGIAPASAAIAVNPRIKLDKAVGHPFIAMGDLDERTMGCRPSQVRSGGSGAKFAQGDTLFARITPCLENGKTGLVQSLADDEVGLGSTEFIVLRGRDVGSAFTYCLARDSDFRENAIASMSGASGRQRVRNECFDSYLLAVPPRALADAFERSMEPLFSEVAVLTDETERLRQLRDLLLPKLVSGQIDVSSLDLDAMDGEQVA